VIQNTSVTAEFHIISNNSDIKFNSKSYITSH